MGSRDEETDWIRRAREGEPEAFGALTERYQRMVHAITFRMTGSLDDADDLAQEVFVQAYRCLAMYRAEARFSSWLHQIAVNTCLNWCKRRRRRAQVHQAWSQQRELSTTHAAASSEAESGPADRVASALSRLPPKQRAAVILTVYEDLSHAQAAKALGCTEATVAWRLFAARRKLKRWLTM